MDNVKNMHTHYSWLKTVILLNNLLTLVSTIYTTIIICLKLLKYLKLLRAIQGNKLLLH